MTVKTDARAMKLDALQTKVQQSQEDCALMQMRLDQMTELGEANSPEVRSIVRAHQLACEWASAGADELQRRAQPKQTAKPRRRSAAPPAAPRTAYVGDRPTKTPWGWILGASAIGLGGLAVLMRRMRR